MFPIIESYLNNLRELAAEFGVLYAEKSLLNHSDANDALTSYFTVCGAIVAIENLEEILEPFITLGLVSFNSFMDDTLEYKDDSVKSAVESRVITIHKIIDALDLSNLEQ